MHVRLWAGIAVATLAPLLTTGAAVAVEVGAPVWVLVTAISAGGFAVAGHEAVGHVRADRSRRDALALELAGLLRTSIPVPAVRDADPYSELGVFRSSRAERVTRSGDRPEYIPRDEDDTLQGLLSDPGVRMVLVRGAACAGKKRSAFEALAFCAGGRPIIVPARPSATTPQVLRRLVELAPPLGGDGAPVLWLDNAERWTDKGDLDLPLVRQLQVRYPGLLIVATLRFGAVRSLAESSASPDVFEARRARETDPVWMDLVAQSWVAEHQVSTEPSDSELAEAGQLYPEYADEAELTQGLGPFFAGFDQLLRKWREGAGHCPVGVALVNAAVDWRRSGLTDPAPRAALKDLMTRPVRPLDDRAIDQALEWATQPVDSGAALLETAGDGDSLRYRVADVMYDHLMEGRGLPATELAVVRQVATVIDRILGPGHPDTLRTRGNVAHWTGRAGKPDEALKLYGELLPDMREALGLLHADTLTTRGNIAYWTGRAGRSGEALRLFTALLPDMREVLGPRHPDTLRTRSNIARWTGETGRRHEALRLLTALLHDREHVLGPDHPETLRTRSNIARWTGETGRPREALHLHTDLLPDVERILGPRHPDTLRTRSYIARWTGETGRRDEALHRYTDLLPDMRRILGPDHPDTVAVARAIERLRQQLAGED